MEYVDQPIKQDHNQIQIDSTLKRKSNHSRNLSAFNSYGDN